VNKESVEMKHVKENVFQVKTLAVRLIE